MLAALGRRCRCCALAAAPRACVRSPAPALGRGWRRARAPDGRHVIAPMFVRAHASRVDPMAVGGPLWLMRVGAPQSANSAVGGPPGPDGAAGSSEGGGSGDAAPDAVGAGTQSTSTAIGGTLTEVDGAGTRRGRRGARARVAPCALRAGGPRVVAAVAVVQLCKAVTRAWLCEAAPSSKDSRPLTPCSALRAHVALHRRREAGVAVDANRDGWVTLHCCAAVVSAVAGLVVAAVADIVEPCGRTTRVLCPAAAMPRHSTTAGLLA